MNKFSQYLSVKIGVIATLPYVSHVLSPVYIGVVGGFVVAILVSSVLWWLVWDWDAAAFDGMPAYKRRAFFAIHVVASAWGPVSGALLVTLYHHSLSE